MFPAVLLGEGLGISISDKAMVICFVNTRFLNICGFVGVSQIPWALSKAVETCRLIPFHGCVLMLWRHILCYYLVHLERKNAKIFNSLVVSTEDIIVAVTLSIGDVQDGSGVWEFEFEQAFLMIGRRAWHLGSLKRKSWKVSVFL